MRTLGLADFEQQGSGWEAVSLNHRELCRERERYGRTAGKEDERRKKCSLHWEHWKKARFSKLLPVSHEGPGCYHAESKEWHQHHSHGNAARIPFTSMSDWPIMHL